MALVQCEDCGQDVSDLAPACPRCSRPQQPPLQAIPAGAPQPGRAYYPPAPERRGSTAGGVFWGLVLFFIVLPMVFGLGSCVACTMCVGAAETAGKVSHGR